MKAGYVSDEPIAAVATALAPAAIGIIRTSGNKAIELVAKFFSRPRSLIGMASHSMVHGWIRDRDGRRIDEVLVAVFRAPKSFTGENMVEIYCHGGTAVVSAIYRLLVQNGFREAERGEFTFRAFINGKRDLLQAEAVREIIEAKTDEARSHALGRLAGGLSAVMQQVREALIESLAAIEAEIEYPEDEESIADAFDDGRLRSAEAMLSNLCDSWASERLFQDGVRVVLCGNTNAGKSSLFNALLKEERAIVSDIHGTTRDWIECGVSFRGLPARLFDTAGLRETEDLIEKEGVERSRALLSDADLVLYVLDSERPALSDCTDFIQQLAKEHAGLPLLLVCNKQELVSAEECAVLEQYASASGLAFVFVSAKTGFGLDLLAERLRSILGARSDTERAGEGLGSARQYRAASEALDSIRHALSVAASADFALDAVGQDIEDALYYLSEITGEITSDDILDAVFSRFCLGK